ncbi:MAG: hypothetical protein HOV80_00280 [Polyangiaceae bacterium]|nr:hypothetical protein [Polyangiaceae bacterium]
MMNWDLFKQNFNAWENQTAKLMEAWMKSPLVLEPAGMWLSTMMKAKAQADKTVAQAWGAVGLPTKRDQERSLHALNQIQSRLLDLEEQLAELKAQKN